MQTFLPFENFVKTAKVLDRQRLGKQRVEASQILNVLSGKTKAWQHHPAVLMWSGFEGCLKCYHDEIIKEWIARGYKNNMPLLATDEDKKSPRPSWLGDEKFHSSHRQTLLFKNINWYSQFGWIETPKYEYFWPVIRNSQ